MAIEIRAIERAIEIAPTFAKPTFVG